MGTLIPALDNAIAGVPCTECWGSGKPFGDGPTPRTIQVTFAGIVTGPSWTLPDGNPVSGTFTLTQSGLGPCLWVFLDATWDIEAFWFDGETVVLARRVGGRLSFSSGIDTPCLLVLPNELIFFFNSGTATIVLPPVI